MEKNEQKNKNEGLIQSKQLLYTKLKRINQLFKIHFSSITLLFLFAISFITLWIFLLTTGQVTTDIAQRYGLFGTIITVILTVALSAIIIQMGMQGFMYGSFIIRGNRYIKRYDGIAQYITNFYAFFNRYSQEKKMSLVMLVRTYLFLNFLTGFFVVFLFTRLIDAEHGNQLLKFVLFIIFLTVEVLWIINLFTSNKIKNEVVKWESLFPKLDDWAQSLEQSSFNNSNFIGNGLS